MTSSANSIAHKLLSDLNDALEEVDDEYQKVIKSAQEIQKKLQGSFDKQAMISTLAKFNISWLEDKLNDLDSVVGDVKTEFNL